VTVTSFDDIDRGESASAQFEIRNPDQTPTDLTGRTVEFAIRPGGDLVHIRSGVDNPAGSVVVTPAEGLITVTLNPVATAAIVTATWTLWLDPDTDTADAVTSGTMRTRQVVPHA